MKKTKVRIKTGSVDDFIKSVRENAARLDRGDKIEPEITIAFEDSLEMLEFLSAERVRLLRHVKRGTLPISDLASQLDRDVRAVSRDVLRLEKAGLLRTRYQVNPGHGRRKLVEPVAQKYVLTASI
jgi:predicted transcriptional regulator